MNKKLPLEKYTQKKIYTLPRVHLQCNELLLKKVKIYSFLCIYFWICGLSCSWQTYCCVREFNECEYFISCMCASTYNENMLRLSSLISVTVHNICFLQITDSETKCQVLTLCLMLAKKQAFLSAYKIPVDHFVFFLCKITAWFG